VDVRREGRIRLWPYLGLRCTFHARHLTAWPKDRALQGGSAGTIIGAMGNNRSAFATSWPGTAARNRRFTAIAGPIPGRFHAEITAVALLSSRAFIQ
jgi:hypothetical protein